MPIDPLPPGSDEDTAWLHALAGRVDARSVDAGAAREGALMRDALRRWQPSVDPVAADDPQRVDRLLARARREGLVPAPAATSARGSPFRSWLAWWNGATSATGRRPALAMAVALVVVAGVFVVGRGAFGPVADDTTVRGAPDAIVLLRVADPAAVRDEIVARLAREGIVATTYRRLDRLGIDAELPPDPSPALVAVLRDHRIPMPADRVLKVELLPLSP